MARRKRGFMDDGISDSSGGSDDENTGEDDPYQRKKRRTTGDEDSEDEGFGGKPKPAQRHDWAKAPAFVSSKPVDQSEVMDIPDAGTLPGSESSDDSAKDEDGQEDADVDDADDSDNSVNDNEDYSEPSKAPSPRIRDKGEEDEEEERPRFGGLGLGASKLHPTSFSGFTKSGIGASRPAAVSIPATPSPVPSSSPAPPASDDPSVLGSLPSAFGGSSRPQRAFVRNATPQAPPPPKPSLSASESLHFRKLEGSFGARMLAKMGWESGTGLGAESKGIVAPIETKVRPKNMGIAFKGFTERTEQSKAEARRRGEVVSDDDKEVGKKKAPKGRDHRKAEKTSDAWKKPKKVKTRTEHKTYEQIVAEVGENTGGPSGLGVIIDATGATVCYSSALN